MAVQGPENDGFFVMILLGDFGIDTNNYGNLFDQ